jgi:hypothetical protein
MLILECRTVLPQKRSKIGVVTRLIRSRLTSLGTHVILACTRAGRGIIITNLSREQEQRVEERSDETPPWRGKNRDELYELLHVRVSLVIFIFVLLMKSVSVSWQNGDNCQDINSDGVCYFVDNSIIYQKMISRILSFLPILETITSNPGISLDVFCYINYSLKGQCSVFG